MAGTPNRTVPAALLGERRETMQQRSSEIGQSFRVGLGFSDPVFSRFCPSRPGLVEDREFHVLGDYGLFAWVELLCRLVVRVFRQESTRKDQPEYAGPAEIHPVELRRPNRTDQRFDPVAQDHIDRESDRGNAIRDEQQPNCY